MGILFRNVGKGLQETSTYQRCSLYKGHRRHLWSHKEGFKEKMEWPEAWSEGADSKPVRDDGLLPEDPPEERMVIRNEDPSLDRALDDASYIINRHGMTSFDKAIQRAVQQIERCGYQVDPTNDENYVRGIPEKFV